MKAFYFLRFSPNKKLPMPRFYHFFSYVSTSLFQETFCRFYKLLSPVDVTTVLSVTMATFINHKTETIEIEVRHLKLKRFTR